jgi:muconolactone delta-isomerase
MSSTYFAAADAGTIANAIIVHSGANMAAIARMTFALGKHMPAGAFERWMMNNVQSDTNKAIDSAATWTKHWKRSGEYVGTSADKDFQITDYMMLYNDGVEVFDVSMVSARFPAVNQFTFAGCCNLKMIDFNGVEDGMKVHISYCKSLRVIRNGSGKSLDVQEMIGVDPYRFEVCLRNGSLYVAWEWEWK